MPRQSGPFGEYASKSGSGAFRDVIENKDVTLINNRQAGRRRGRNNSRPQGNGRGGDSGNRIDNRARGNAAQLLEKYKNLARDAQTQGDRVNAEYYLQFADHYFRVLADNRARQEEQQNWRRNRDDNRFDMDEEEDLELEGEGVGGDTEEAQPRSGEMEERGFEREPRFEREARFERRNERPDRRNDRQGERGPRRGRGQREETPPPVEAEAPAPVQRAPETLPAEPVAVEEAAAKPKRAPRQKRAPKAQAAEENHGMDAAILPPSISRADNDSGEEVAAPRKRTRRTRTTAEAAE